MAPADPALLPAWLPVEVRAGPVPVALAEATHRGVLWQAAPGRFLLAAPQAARYLAEGGQRLTIERAPGAAEGTVIRLARSTPLAALLYQAGWLALHAAALVRPAGGAVLLAGDSGAGKSTLLAALLGRGWRLLADDLAILGLDAGGQPTVYPTGPELLLWPDAMAKTGLTESGLAGAPVETLANGKAVFSLAGCFCPDPAPLQAVYLLGVSRGQAAASEPGEALSGMAFLKRLNGLLYNSQVADAILDRAVYLRTATALTRGLRLQQVTRPPGVWCLAELAERIQ